MHLSLLQIDRVSMQHLCEEGILRRDGRVEILSDATHTETGPSSGEWRAVVRVGPLLCTLFLEYDHLAS